MDDAPKDAFAVLMANATAMCPPEDPWYIACLYKIALVHIDSSEPLFGITYHGQTLGSGDLDPMDVVTRRWKQEIYDAGRKHKQAGLLAALETFGADAFHFELVEFKRGRRSAMQRWVDEAEVAAIAKHGGPLRSMSERCAQTLNLTNGGSGLARWECVDAFRMVAFEKFKSAMEAYVAEYGDALVPKAYEAPSGYKLGQRLNGFRSDGDMRVGLPKQSEIEAWAESLPKWAWKARETDEYKEANRQSAKRQWEEADEETRARWRAAMSEAQNRPEVVEASRQSAKRQWEEVDAETRAKWCASLVGRWADADEETRDKWRAAISEAQNRPEVVEAKRERGKRQWEEADEATRDKWCAGLKEAMNRPEVAEANRERGKRRWADADDEKRATWCANIKEAKSRPEVLKATSESVILQRKRECFDEPEREAKRAAKQSATWGTKFETKMQGKSEEERLEMQKQRACRHRAHAKQKADLERLRTVWPDAKRSDLPKARREGLVPAPASSVVSNL